MDEESSSENAEMGDDQTKSLTNNENEEKNLNDKIDIILSENSTGLKFDDDLQVQLNQLRPKDECENKGDFMLCDMGGALPFKADSFDGVISVSAIQWLC